MKRRHFMRLAALTGISFPLFQGRLFANDQVGSVLSFPVDTHVRHGIWDTQKSIDRWPAWVRAVRKDRFFSNGWSEGNNDLTSVQFELKNETIGIQQVEKRIWINHRNGLVEIGHGAPAVIGQDIKVDLIKTGKEPAYLDCTSEEMLLVPLNGSVWVNGQQVTKEEVFYQQRKQSLFIQGEPMTRLIRITNQ